MAGRPFFGDQGRPIITPGGRPAFDGACECVADFSYVHVSGRTYAFTDETTPDATDWGWTFHEGATSSVQDPTYEFPADGRYTVKLLALVDGELCLASAVIDIGDPTPCGNSGYSNIDSFTRFSVDVSGFTNHKNCLVCPENMNTAWILGPDCEWRETKGFCSFLGSGDGFVRWNLVGLRVQAGRIDDDGDGTPPHTHAGQVYGNYEVPGDVLDSMGNTGIFLDSVTVNLLPNSFGTTPDNGPCNFNPPNSLTVSML